MVRDWVIRLDVFSRVRPEGNESRFRCRSTERVVPQNCSQHAGGDMSVGNRCHPMSERVSQALDLL